MSTLKLMEQFTTIPLPNGAEGNTMNMDTMEGQPPLAHPSKAVAKNNPGWTASIKGKAHATRGITQPRQSDGDTFPERRAYNVHADHAQHHGTATHG